MKHFGYGLGVLILCAVPFHFLAGSKPSLPEVAQPHFIANRQKPSTLSSPVVVLKKAKPTVEKDGPFLHPAVHLANPERIRSFREPEVHQAYDVYFSLIGPAKEKYPFAKSSLDSVENLRFVFKSLRTLSYAGQRKIPNEEFKETVLQISHLAAAEAGNAASLRETLISKWVQDIENAPSKREALLTELNLRSLLTAMPEAEGDTLGSLYAGTSSKIVKSSVAFALIQRLEQKGMTDEEIRQHLAKDAIEYPQIKSFPGTGGKS